MSVTLLRAYAGYVSGAVVSLDSDTEAALITQGIATAFAGGITASSRVGAPDMYGSQGGNLADIQQGGLTSTITASVYAGPLIYPVINLGSAALTTYETNGTAPVAGTMYLTEIYVPYAQTWTGIGKLNGTTATTDNHLVALYGANGALLASSAVAGVLAATASVMQNISFTAPITLIPGKYFLGFQSNGTTATVRHLVAVNGANIMTGSQAGVFGTVPATLTTVPVTFTNAQGVIMQLFV